MSGVGGFGTSLLRFKVGESGKEGACRVGGEIGAGGAFRFGGAGAGCCGGGGSEGSDLFIRSVRSDDAEATEYVEAIEYAEAIEYVLDGTREGASFGAVATEYVLDGTREGISFGGVGGTSSTCTESLLKDRNEIFELYPLSALASGFGGRSFGPFNNLFGASPLSYAESNDLGARSESLGVEGSAENKSSSIAVCLLVDSNFGDERGELSKENGLNAKSC